MNIVVDENIPIQTVVELRALEHSVLDLRETDDKGADDAILWRLAQERRALLISTDKGFVRFRAEQHAGILIIRVSNHGQRPWL